MNPDSHRLIAEALKALWKIQARYCGAGSGDRMRVLEPYGLLLGTRRYLVARESESRNGLQHFRLDRLHEMKLMAESFPRDADFDLQRHAARAFGSYQSEAEFGEVVWRFEPRAAPVAEAFIFRPDQHLESQADGSLIVRFLAGGWLEMAWHLYQWGDAVEVLAPEALRQLVAGYQRSNFDALP